MFIYPEGSTSVVAQIVDTRHRGPCGKACYGSARAAVKALRQMKRHGREQRYRGRLHEYPCPQCRAWHVGHTSYED